MATVISMMMMKTSKAFSDEDDDNDSELTPKKGIILEISNVGHG